MPFLSIVLANSSGGAGGGGGGGGGEEPSRCVFLPSKINGPIKKRI